MFFRENKKIIIQAIFGLLFIGLAFFFIRYQRTELIRVRTILGNADIPWVLFGISISLVFIGMQGLMYDLSFRTISEKIPFLTATKVFLKRNFIGVFLPAGGVASLGFFTRDFERKHVPLTKSYFASSIYIVTNSFSLVIVALPALLWSMLRRSIASNQIWSFIGLILLVALIIFLIWSLVRQGFVYRLIVRIWPPLEKYLAEIRSVQVRILPYVLTLSVSVIIELIGVFHIMIAMRTLGYPVSFEAALMAYITSMLFQVISPFMRGLGAIELSMTFILTRFGYNTIDAISITLLYRFFIFWLPLLISGLSFGFTRNKLLLRIVPAVLSFLVGILNIMSVMTPPLPDRLETLLRFVTPSFLDGMEYLMMMTGLLLLVNSAFMLKGLRTAWYVAVAMAVVSVIGQILSALNYQEALFSVVLIASLFYTRRQYFVVGNPLFGQISILTALLAVVAVMSYGVIGFYFLEERFFHREFSIAQALKYTLHNFFLYKEGSLDPSNPFARDFLLTIRIAGSLSIIFLVYTLMRPVIRRFTLHEEERAAAKELVKDSGNSAFDHLKPYPDKFLFFTHGIKTFLSYNVAGNYALVLENPVSSSEEEMKQCIAGFDSFCSDNGLKNFYFLIPEKSLSIYEQLGKKTFLAGQMAVVELADYSTETLPDEVRKAIRECSEKEYFSRIISPPVPEDILERLETISMSWLTLPGKKDTVFSKGIFVKQILKEQEILVIEDRTGRFHAFMNLIRIPASRQVTFDLLRKTAEMPDGVLYFLVSEFLLHLKNENVSYANLGFAPMPGIENGEFHHMSLKFAYEKLCGFPPYRGLRELREKFGPQWQNLYVAYEHHYDLFDLPSVLKKVSRPHRVRHNSSI